MNIAYFSPFNPQKSGISSYSERLVPFLGRHCEIDLWVDGFHPLAPSLSPFKKIDYARNQKIRKRLARYDMRVYNIGNNPEFHSGMLDVFLEYPGVVILHDYVLFYLITGYYLSYVRNEAGLIKEFYENYGRRGIDAVKDLLRSPVPPLQYQHPEYFPLIKKITECARGIIVHSDYTRNLVLQAGYDPERIAYINMVHSDGAFPEISPEEAEIIRRGYGIGPDDILVASFGFIAPTKRNLEIIEVVRRLSEKCSQRIIYLMVGEGNYVDGFLSDTIQKTGYVPSRQLDVLLMVSDIVVNLRYPSMGETSATLLHAMTAGKPCVVSDNAWFRELPNETVLKISCDRRKEQRELESALLLLINEKEQREQIGEKARDYVLRNHNPETIAGNMKDFFHHIHQYESSRDGR